MTRRLDINNRADAPGILYALAQTLSGRRDRTAELPAELVAELPGILNWALDGRDRLMAQGHFTRPAAGGLDPVELARAWDADDPKAIGRTLQRGIR